jgi:hypothetical protein
VAAPLPLDEIVDDISTRMTERAFDKIGKGEPFGHAFAVIMTKDQRTGGPLVNQSGQHAPYMVSYMWPQLVGAQVDIDRAKDALADMVRTIAIASEAVAVVMTMDTWVVAPASAADFAVRPSQNSRRKEAIVTLVERVDLRSTKTTMMLYTREPLGIVRHLTQVITDPFGTMDEDIVKNRFAALPRTPPTDDRIAKARETLRGSPSTAHRAAGSWPTLRKAKPS